MSDTPSPQTPAGAHGGVDSSGGRGLDDSVDAAIASMSIHPTGTAFDPATVTRPDERLLRYYQIVAAFTLVFFPITFIPLYLRYRTLRYRFDDEGVGMSVGFLFKQETYLTYRRIQDIHVTRGLLQRWLGLATVAVQTAAGSASAEMTIEGVADPDGLRDWLYTRMRGVHDGHDAASPASTAADGGRGIAHASPGGQTDVDVDGHVRPNGPVDDETLDLLRQIRDEVRALRAATAPPASDDGGAR
jgi:membrane protein YdbS with pleckstrin-like domain